MVNSPWRCTPGKGTRYPLNRRLSGPQSRSERFGGKNAFLSLLEFEPRTMQFVAWSLYQPRYPVTLAVLVTYCVGNLLTSRSSVRVSRVIPLQRVGLMVT
jgi:hypothetical protein